MEDTRDGRKRRGAATRLRIVEAAVALIGRGGLAGLTSATLAAEVGVSKGTVFHHFPSLDQVPMAVLDYIIGGLVEAVQHHDTARGYLLQSGRDVLRLTAERAEGALAMQALYAGADQHPQLAERLAELSTGYRDRMAHELIGLAPATPPERARAVADITVTAVDGLAMHLSLTGERERLEAAWHQLVEALLITLDAPGASTEAHP